MGLTDVEGTERGEGLDEAYGDETRGVVDADVSVRKLTHSDKSNTPVFSHTFELSTV